LQALSSELKATTTMLLQRALLTLLVTLIASICAPKPATGQNQNVLFIAVDDLRPELGTYGIDFVNL